MNKDTLDVLRTEFPALSENVKFLADTDEDKHSIGWMWEEVVRRGVSSITNQRKQAKLRQQEKKTAEDTNKFNAWLRTPDGIRIATTDPVALLKVMKSYGIGAEAVIQAAAEQKEKEQASAAA